jgi:hypothetical protein
MRNTSAEQSPHNRAATGRVVPPTQPNAVKAALYIRTGHLRAAEKIGPPLPPALRGGLAA